MWKQWTQGLERYAKQAEKKPWRINMEDGLLLSAQVQIEGQSKHYYYDYEEGR